MTIKQVAEMKGVSIQAVSNAVRLGTLNAVKDPEKKHVNIADDDRLRAYLDAPKGKGGRKPAPVDPAPEVSGEAV